MATQILTGVEMILELKRVATVPQDRKPFMVAHVTDPKIKGGWVHEGVTLMGFGSAPDEHGLLQRISISVTQGRLGMHFGWHPDGSTQPKDDAELTGLEVFWNDGYYQSDISGRVGMGDGELDRFLATLPQQPDEEVVYWQRRLEATLPKAQNGLVEGTSSARRK